MTTRPRLPPAPKTPPQPKPRAGNRTRAQRAERGLSALEVALRSHLTQAIRTEATYQGLTVAALVRQWAERLYLEQVESNRQAKPAKNKAVPTNRQAKSKKG